MRAKQLILDLFNRPLELLGVRIVPTWSVQWWTAAAEFNLWGRQYRCFYHAYNCGWPPYASERCVELALADAWLSQVEGDVVEVGAVTPYYWPNRVKKVIDPYDPHSKVTDRKSLFEIDLRGSRVLSISTFEHIGTGDYGITEESASSPAAFRKVFNESPQFLLTVPAGYNPMLDQFIFEKRDVPSDVALGVLVREGQSGWRQEQDLARAKRPYGDHSISIKYPGTSIGRWANAVIVLERGGVLASARMDH